jgi:hypothetical protein
MIDAVGRANVETTDACAAASNRVELPVPRSGACAAQQQATRKGTMGQRFGDLAPALWGLKLDPASQITQL